MAPPSLVPLFLAACAGSMDPPMAAAEAIPGAASPTPPGGVVDRLDLAAVTWGADLPNSVKAMSVAWDPVTGRVFTAGMASGVLLVTDPAQGHPVAAVDLAAEDHQLSEVWVDPERRRLTWLSRSDGHLRLVDLDRLEVVARWDRPPGPPAGAPPPEGRGSRKGKAWFSGHPDPVTGGFWLLDPRNGTITGFDEKLRPQDPVPGLTDAMRVVADPRDGTLYGVDHRGEGDIRLVRWRPGDAAPVDLKTFDVAHSWHPNREQRGSAGRPPRGQGGPGGGRPPRAARDGLPIPGDLVVASDGTLLLTGPRMLVAAGPDLEVRWSAPLPTPAVDVGEGGGRVVVALGQDPRQPDRPASRVQVLDLATGALLADLEARYEARLVTVAPDGSQAFVSNGGDGSVTWIDLAAGAVRGHLDVAVSADGLVVDPASGDRFILDRLGGSLLHAWRADGTVEHWDAGPWPVDFALDPDRRRLLVLAHYESALRSWDIEEGAPLPSLPLGIPGSTGDTVGDLAWDRATGRVAVVAPEHGQVALADPATGTVHWTREVPGLAAGRDAGPGHGFVGIRGDEVWVALPEQDRIEVLALQDGATLASVPLPPGTGAALPFQVNALYVDEVGGRVFLGGQPVDVATRTAGTALADVDLVFHVEEGQLLGLAQDRDGREVLVVADPETGRSRLTVPLGTRRMMSRQATWDAPRQVAWVSSLPDGTVIGYKLPPPTPGPNP